MDYRTATPIGHGAMGRVYRVWDPDNGRYVALKYLRIDDPDWIRRMQREARVQGRLEHPNIARVYEVGEHEGRTCIAMEYIDGRPLDTLMDELPLEAGVALLADCADALHTAHTAGLIHRDVKPANILVAENDDGALHPYLLDFGLVLSLGDETLTAAGDLLGTPGYMSPEQAAGRRRDVDRRSDIFSLGCILYELLTGKPPFHAETRSEILGRLLREDAQPPRRLDRQVPRALERVCLQCLEREPRRRYASAAALRDDLRRWLDGDSVTARHAGTAWRTGRFLRRNPVTAGMAGATLVLALATAGWAWHTQQQAEQRAARAQRTGEALKDMEWRLRGAWMAPGTDVVWHKQRLRESADALTRELSAPGETGGALADYVLGRTRLLLGETRRAVAHLEAAHHAGTTPEADLWLGYALARRYREVITGLAAIRDPELRAQRRSEADARLRDRSLAILRDAPAADNNAEFRRATVAWLEERDQAALEHARASRLHRPWFIEALLLETDVRQTRLGDLQLAGAYNEAAADLEAVIDLLVRGMAIAPSAPELTARACEAVYTIHDLDTVSGEVHLPDPGLDLAVCDHLVAMEPDVAHHHVLRARAYAERWNYLRQTGAPPDHLADTAIAAARRSIQLGQDDPEVLHLGGKVLSDVAGRMRQDPDRIEALLRESLALATRIIDMTPGDVLAYNQAGIESRRLADHLRQTGRDPTPILQQGIEYLRRAVAMRPDHPFPRHNLAYTLKTLATHGESTDSDPEQLLLEAIEQSLKSLETNPDSMLGHNTLGNIYSDLGRHRLLTGKSAESAMEKALEHYTRTSEINPTFRKPYNNRANLCRVMAEHLTEAGRDPSPWIQRGRTAAREALDIKPDYAFAWFNLGALGLVEARYREAGGGDVAASARAATAAFDKGLKRMGSIVGAWQQYGESALMLAAHSDDEAERASAQAAVRKAMRRIRDMAPDHDSLELLSSGLAGLGSG